ncbi:hypothetical protein EZV62_007814 [Acer yangbiense]|uniref:Uncharacterized protein n=1 Tax=Acer yangbiense TaxID=1000413 RepID=A0A5C7ICG0_9ROSI|nr:hypothetical protein EZV62_007814 [Acer yangbiense]
MYFPRRSSTGRESLSSLRDFENNENIKDPNLKPARVQSPASASKGTNNFMSPTISSASKFATSPRKKILAERNEPVRSSVSFSEAKVQAMEDNDSKPEISLAKKKTAMCSDVGELIMEENDFSKPEMSLNQIVSSHDSTITDLGREETVKSDSIFNSEVLFDSKNDVSSSLEAATGEKDSVNINPTFKISPRTSCPPLGPMLAPLDADPLMPPYDPKTNYLVPRPQFLYYRPNMRIKYMPHKDKDSESFASENSSDSEGIEILSQEESEDISSVETEKEIKDEAVDEEEEELDVSEPNEEAEEEEEEEELDVFEPNVEAVEEEEEELDVSEPNEEAEEEEEEEELDVFEPNVEAVEEEEEELDVSEPNEEAVEEEEEDEEAVEEEEEELDVSEPNEEAVEEEEEELDVSEDISSVETEKEIKEKAVEEEEELDVTEPNEEAEEEEEKELDVSEPNVEAVQEEEELDVSEPNEEAEEEEEEELNVSEPNEEAEEEEEEELDVSEPNPFTTHRPKEESVAKGKSKSKCFTVPKFIAFFLVLFFACLSLSVSDSQVADFSLSTNFYVPHEVTEFAKVNFEELFRKSRLRSTYSFAYICKLIPSLRGMNTLGPLQYSNLAVLLEKDHLVDDGHLKFVQKDASADFNYEMDFLASIRERNVDSEPLEEEGHEEIEDDENIEEEENQSDVVIPEVTTTTQPDVKISEVIENQPDVAVLKVFKIQLDVSFAEEEPHGETDVNSELDASRANLQNLATFNGSQNIIDLTKNFVSISLSVLLSLLVAIAFFTYANAKKGKPSTPISVSAEHTLQEKMLSSRNWQTEVQVGECPSEMSSFKSMSSRNWQIEDEMVRESCPSESHARTYFPMGSLPYGGFSSYEKISPWFRCLMVLKGHGEDEVVTPVRRSSRIRKLVNFLKIKRKKKTSQFSVTKLVNSC